MPKNSQDLKIEYRDPKDLIPYVNNARTHSEEQVTQIASSIKEFGFNNPILLDGENGVIAGHGRLLASIKLGLSRVPCIELSHLSEVEKKAYILADNKIALNSDWDMGTLKLELDALKLDDFDLSLTGFDVGEIEAFSGGDEDGEEEDSADDAPVLEDELTAEPKTKKGDVWILGEHKLMCGDSTLPEDLEKLIGDEKIALLLTDPPYGVGIVQEQGRRGIVSGEAPRPLKFAQLGGASRTKFGDREQEEVKMSENKKKLGGGYVSTPYGEHLVGATYYANFANDDSTETAKKSYEIAKDKAKVLIIFGGNYFTDFLPPSRCWLVWDKGVPEGVTFAQVELAWVSKDANAKIYRHVWSGLRREGDRTEEGKKRVHPTQKPVGLMKDLIEDFSKSGDTVLDLFGGSGSTLIACERTGRKCRMMEFTEYYCDVIIKRWQRLTGMEAVRADGVKFNEL